MEGQGWLWSGQHTGTIVWRDRAGKGVVSIQRHYSVEGQGW